MMMGSACPTPRPVQPFSSTPPPALDAARPAPAPTPALAATRLLAGEPVLAHGPRIPPASPRELIEITVADVFHVDVEELRGPTRGRARIALARQVAMYIAHTACGLSLTDVGRLFGRDRTTAAHACKLVEQQREDQEFDKAVDLLALVVRVLLGPQGSRARPPG